MTWYEATAQERFSTPALDGEARCDVAIVGGGLAGLALAWMLAGDGVAVTLLEADGVGAAASGRNGGFCSPGWSAGGAGVRALAGAERARALHALSREGVEWMRARMAEPGFASAAPQPGKIRVSLVDQPDALKAVRDEAAREHGETLRYLARDELRALINSPRYHQGLANDAAFHFHPLDFCRALAREAVARGAAIHESSAMRRLERAPGGWVLHAGAGRLSAERVVLAAGGYGGRELGRLRRAWLPITTYVGVTEPLGDRAATAIRTGCAIADDRRAGNYYRLLPEGRLLWGRDITAFAERDPGRIAARVARDISWVFPQLGQPRIDYAWSGKMAYARHMMPYVGPLGDGLWSLTAFGGHGMNTAPAAALTLSEALAGGGDRWRLFEPFALTWNGGPFGPFAAEATYRAYQLRDAWRAWRSRSTG